MAIGTPVERFAARLGAAGGSSTRAFSPATTVTAGTNAVLLVCRVGSTGCTLTSVTDTPGNTWVVDRNYTIANGALSPVAAASCIATTQILSSDTITMTFSAVENLNTDVYLMEVSGLSVSPFDTFAEASITPVNGAWAVGPTATLAQANEVAFLVGYDAQGGRTMTLAGWDSPTTPDFNVGHLRHKTVAATTAISASGTWNLASTTSLLIVTYKGIAEASVATGILPPLLGRSRGG